ncbi:MAG: carbon starvation protein A, partial [Candidatus Hydrogenedentota bacterium]
LPLAMMVIVPAWAMTQNVIKWHGENKWLLVGIGIAVLILEAWMILEAALMWKRARGVLPEPLPPLKPLAGKAAAQPGRQDD